MQNPFAKVSGSISFDNFYAPKNKQFATIKDYPKFSSPQRNFYRPSAPFYVGPRRYFQEEPKTHREKVNKSCVPKMSKPTRSLKQSSKHVKKNIQKPNLAKQSQEKKYTQMFENINKIQEARQKHFQEKLLQPRSRSQEDKKKGNNLTKSLEIQSKDPSKQFENDYKNFWGIEEHKPSIYGKTYLKNHSFNPITGWSFNYKSERTPPRALGSRIPERYTEKVNYSSPSIEYTPPKFTKRSPKRFTFNPITGIARNIEEPRRVKSSLKCYSEDFN